MWSVWLTLGIGVVNFLGVSFVSIYTRVQPSDWAQKRRRSILMWFCGGSVILITLTTTLAYFQQRSSDKAREEALSASERTRSEVTGGNSFPQLAPQFSPSIEAGIPVNLFVKGDYALSDMWISVDCLNLGTPPRRPLGTVPPGQWIEAAVLMPLKDCARSIQDGNGEAMYAYNVNVTARNGFFRELLQLKVVDRCKVVEFRYRMYLQDDFQLLDKGQPVGAKELMNVPEDNDQRKNVDHGFWCGVPAY